MYPAAVVYHDWVQGSGGLSLGWVAFAEVFFFVAVLALGLAYLWSKGDLEWVKSYQPVKKEGD
jgi:NADH-quinone oxidoreductase subunit A